MRMLSEDEWLRGFGAVAQRNSGRLEGLDRFWVLTWVGFLAFSWLVSSPIRNRDETGRPEALQSPTEKHIATSWYYWKAPKLNNTRESRNEEEIWKHEHLLLYLHQYCCWYPVLALSIPQPRGFIISIIDHRPTISSGSLDHCYQADGQRLQQSIAQSWRRLRQFSSAEGATSKTSGTFCGRDWLRLIAKNDRGNISPPSSHSWLWAWSFVSWKYVLVSVIQSSINASVCWILHRPNGWWLVNACMSHFSLLNCVG